MSQPPPPTWTKPPRAFVVAGGRSTRMGQDKALLPYAGTTLLSHAISKLREVTQDVHILCGPARRYEGLGTPVVEDAICGVGPLGGLYSALVAAQTDGVDRIVWVAVDVPLVPPSLLTGLLAELDQAEVAIARTSQGLEPLCGAFRTMATLECVQRALVEGRLKLTSALEGLNIHVVDADSTSFVNVNSLSEYRQLTQYERWRKE